MMIRLLILFLIATGLGWVRASHAAEVRPYAPSQVPTPASTLENDSYLSSVDTNLPLGPQDLQSEILDPRKALELRQEYEGVSSSYQMRQYHGLVDPFEAQGYQSRMSDFSKKVVDELRKHHAVDKREKARRAVEGDVRKLPGEVLTVAGVAYNLYAGEKMEWTLNPYFKVSGWTSVQDRKANVGFSSAIVDGSMDFVADAPEVRNPTTPIDPALGERYKVNIARALPILDLTSGVSYGSSTSTVSASLSKPLADKVVGIYESSHPIQYPLLSEEKFRVQYEVHF